MELRLTGLVELDCPRCGYGLEVDLVDARTHVSRFCPVCKTRLDLRDGDGSVYGAEQEIEAALKELTDAFDDLDLTIEF